MFHGRCVCVCSARCSSALGSKNNNNNLLERWWVVWHFGSLWGVLGEGRKHQLGVNNKHLEMQETIHSTSVLVAPMFSTLWSGLFMASTHESAGYCLVTSCGPLVVKGLRAPFREKSGTLAWALGNIVKAGSICLPCPRAGGEGLLFTSGLRQ